ncbi:NAD-dependent epimerase/dehydratase family protein [Roseinatronobacter bogoriensis]|uniref:NAD-dependent epimerase/dehydratase domain-containing protein n=1 Tax=Roseinatronobacter bogoriensis subsp. barguzinensis TaxID=441209 RepID=A0A2K8KDS7_9RHOB|nr:MULTISPECIES: NAD-dependent epimerase/dehydratase family protein [Rhodobaca]ATX65885.1 hypothetical protein BG454_08630 [Rhodobaca barguzinensis]
MQAELIDASAPHVHVTGSAGYIGRHACKQLARAGYVPVTFDNLSTGWAGQSGLQSWHGRGVFSW